MPESKLMYPNTTQVSNYILDNMYLFSDGELRVLLFITRKTVGWHKETDFLRYTQILVSTGIKSKTTLSHALTSLLNKELIVRVDKNGTQLPMGQTGYRGEIFYTLNKELVQNMDKLIPVPDLSKNRTTTSPKNGQYKTNSYKTKLNTDKDTVVSSEIKRPKGMQRMAEILVSKGLKPKSTTIKGIHRVWQDKAFRYADKLGIKLEGRDTGRWLSVFKRAEETGRKAANLEQAYTYLVDYPQKLSNADKIKFFFYIYENGLKKASDFFGSYA